MVLPDTNILIAYFSHEEPAFSLLGNHIQKKEIVLSVICVAEFLIKATKEENYLINQLINEIGLLDLNRKIMDQAVLYRKSSLAKSKRVYLLDCFIAATAKIYKATLITQDRRDYPFTDINIKQPEEFQTSS